MGLPVGCVTQVVHVGCHPHGRGTHRIPLHLAKSELVATWTLVGCQVHMFGVLWVQQGGWFAGVGFMQCWVLSYILGAVKDTWEVISLPAARLSYDADASSACSSSQQMDDWCTRVVASVGAVIAVAMVVYAVNAALRHVFVVAV